MSLEDYTANEREALLRFTKHTFMLGWEMSLRGEALYNSVETFVMKHPELMDPFINPDTDPGTIDFGAIRAAYYTHVTLYRIEREASQQDSL